MFLLFISMVMIWVGCSSYWLLVYKNQQHFLGDIIRIEDDKDTLKLIEKIGVDGIHKLIVLIILSPASIYLTFDYAISTLKGRKNHG